MPPIDRVYTETSEEWELFLLALRYRGSRLVTLGGNEPFLLAGAGNAWMVHKGTADIFAVEIADGAPVGARHHLFRANRYDLLLGQDLAGGNVGLIAVCGPETEMLRFGTDRLSQQLEKSENVPIIARLVDNWTRALAAGIESEVRPKDYQRLEVGQPLTLAAGEIVRTTREILWVQHEAGRSYFLGRDDIGPVGAGLLPVSDRVWLRAAEPTTLHPLSTLDLVQQASPPEPVWDRLAAFHAVALDLVARDIVRSKQDAAAMLHEQAALDEQRLHLAVTQLASTWRGDVGRGFVSAARADLLLAACDRVGQALGVRFKSPPDYDGTGAYQDSLEEIARASRVRTRLVLLRGEWWRKDAGPLLAYREQGDERTPVALLPGAHGYLLHDPAACAAGQAVQPVDAALAAQLFDTAYTFYRPLPDRPLTMWDVLRFGQRGTGRDWLTLLITGALGGVLGLIVPVITGILFDQLIPAGDRSQIWVVGAVLVISAVAMAVFQVARGIALLSIEGRLDSAIYAALWDRILSLPTDFFRKYSAGDLTERAIGFITLKQVLSGTVILTVFVGVFSWLNLIVMASYDAELALMAVGLVLVGLIVSLVLGVRFLGHQRAVAHTRGQISGLVTQLIAGMSKLRVAGAENRAFYLWATAFSAQKKRAFKAQSMRNAQTIFSAAYPVLAAMIMFAVVAERDRLSTGAFLAFYAAFVQFLAAMMALSAALLTVLATMPLAERLRPILQLRPEVDEQKAHPGELTGAIEVNHVSFHYDKDGPLILDNVTFNVDPGEFVALVGSSGSGKSTLLRHLLGFEMPDSGAVYYDGQALAEVDLRAVRHQIGVVLQHSQVLTGTILDNIIGASRLTAEDAWDAARRAGIADDIEQMPMGMQTYISEGGSTFSGGQRQRLLIARALVTRPRIIFFDEATSALDDKAQAHVIASLKQVDATRIVIAHRLNTIIDADRILVMDRGRLVESGTYQALMAQRGVFARLAERQLI